MSKTDHGKPSTYNNHKCRCPKCTKAWAAYVKKYVQAKRKRDKDKKKKGVQIQL